MRTVEVFVVKVANAKPIIRLHTTRDLELITIHKNVSKIQEDDNGGNLLDNYKDVFSVLGLVDGEYHIVMRDDAKPTIPTDECLS